MILMGHVQGTWPRRELFGDKRTFAARRPDTRAEDVDRMTIPKNSQSGFTLVELLIVIAVIGTLVAMLMPAINSARERGRQTVCASRMQQIGIALTKANANKRGKMRTVDGTPMNILDPTLLQPDPQGTEQWQKDGTLSAELQEAEDVWKCPSATGSYSYGFNERLAGMGGRDGSRIVIIEYNEPVVNIAGQTGGTPGGGNGNPQDTWSDGDAVWNQSDAFAPRHMTMANAYTHGKSTASYQPDEIDPNDCWSQKQYWLPNRDRLTKIDWPETPQDKVAYHDQNPYSCPHDGCSEMVDRQATTCEKCGQSLTPPQPERDDPYFDQCDWK